MRLMTPADRQGMRCPICKRRADRLRRNFKYSLCGGCYERLPYIMVKACSDPGHEYALRMRTGEQFMFAAAYYVGGDFVTISLLPNGEGKAFHYPRGVQVSIDDIVWIADDPRGKYGAAPVATEVS